MFSFFYFQKEKHAKGRTVLTTNCGVSSYGYDEIDIEKISRIVSELEESGLIQFDELGNVSLLVLEGKS